MEQKLPRLVIAGTNSGCGKTTVTCAVLQALVNRGLSVAAAKCGPDYIDPMFHSRIIGAKSANLDPFFFDEPTLRYLLAQNAAGCAVTIIEGVMGYYDGLGLTTTRASTWETAQKTASPTI
ncbi:MAG: cobyrinic acid a,c-diamide synthase, partial [Clostridiales bacterium]|nr:cobyrinic acid a,c-diamide synthase [Clostridiales bacterium]